MSVITEFAAAEIVSRANVNQRIADANSVLSSVVPVSRTVNGKALTGDITLTASDVGALSAVSITGMLTTSEWSNLKQTISVSGITASTPGIVSPDPTSVAVWGQCGIYASAQSNGTVTFTCLTVPTVNVNVQFIVFS